MCREAVLGSGPAVVAMLPGAGTCPKTSGGWGQLIIPLFVRGTIFSLLIPHQKLVKLQAMDAPDFLTITEQVAVYLRGEIMRGRWSGTMPGMNHLAPELDVNAKTVEAALRLLEKEGVLVSQGVGRPRKIVLPEDHAPPALRVAVLFGERGDEAHYLFTGFQNKLKAAGHTVFGAPKNLTDIGTNMRRLARMIKETKADAWVVIAGSKEVLQYFVQRKIPAFALFGWQSQLKIAGIGPNHAPATITISRRLIDLGHRRIVWLDQQTSVTNPGPDGYLFSDELKAHGIPVSNYNMPGWEGGFEGFYRCLDSLFAHTHPTAILLFSATQYVATTQFLINRGLRVPQDVSLICFEKDPYFNRFQPSISHVAWSLSTMVNRIVRWANNISHGKEDIRQTRIDTEFIEGGTVGPAPGRR
jgi:DNA-binding LacI/PurR family transcriptional regulator